MIIASNWNELAIMRERFSKLAEFKTVNVSLEDEYTTQGPTQIPSLGTIQTPSRNTTQIPSQTPSPNPSLNTSIDLLLLLTENEINLQSILEKIKSDPLFINCNFIFFSDHNKEYIVKKYYLDPAKLDVVKTIFAKNIELIESTSIAVARMILSKQVNKSEGDSLNRKYKGDHGDNTSLEHNGEFMKKGSKSPKMAHKHRLILIGVSTGGPEALEKIFLKINNPVKNAAILIVQHMLKGFTEGLANRLKNISGHPVREGADKHILQYGDILLAPAGKHMLARATDKGPFNLKIELSETAPVHNCRPSIDELFSSVAKSYGGQGVLAVVLTGIGQDGASGGKELKAVGARIMVQDKESAVVWGMPSSLVNNGIVDEILSIDLIGAKISNFINTLI